ncbi:MAG: ribose 5-phosphate isomerase B [Chloroflexota bacterium]
MQVAVATDHAGFSLKETVINQLEALGHDVLDLGTHSNERVDFPDFAQRVGIALQEKQAERGVLLCGSGIGMCMAANKMVGVRASIAHDTYSAAQGVEHDGMNVLCLGSRVVGEEVAKTLVTSFMGAELSKEERFHKRIDKIIALETAMNTK